MREFRPYIETTFVVVSIVNYNNYRYYRWHTCENQSMNQFALHCATIHHYITQLIFVLHFVLFVM